MPLIPSTLSAELKSIYAEMKEKPMDENAYADRLSQIITAYILTATVTTTVTGTSPSGPIAGAGTGTLS